MHRSHKLLDSPTPGFLAEKEVQNSYLILALVIIYLFLLASTSGLLIKTSFLQFHLRPIILTFSLKEFVINICGYNRKVKKAVRNQVLQASLTEGN